MELVHIADPHAGYCAGDRPSHLIFGESLLETVRKGILRQRLGRVPSMRRAYQTDLSDAEWSYIESHIPTPKAPGRPRVHTLRERSLTPSSTSFAAAVPGAYSAPRLSSLEDRPPLLQNVAHRRHLEEASRCPAQATASP